MRAAEIIAWHHQAELNRIAACDSVWAEAALRGLDWLEAQRDEEALQAAYHQLSPFARGALELVLRHFGPLPFDEERLLRAAAAEGRWAGAELRQGLTELRRSAILLAASKAWGDELLFLPADAFGAWQHAVLPLQVQPLAREQGRQVTARCGADRQPLSLQLLKGLRVLVPSGLELTSRGLLPQKSIRRLLSRLSMQEEELSGWEAGFAYRDDYPKAAAFVLDLALSMELLKPDGNGYSWNGPTAEAWMALDGPAREHQLVERVVCRYMRTEAALARCGAELMRLEPGRWYALADVQAWLCAPGATREALAADMEAAKAAALACCSALFGACGWLERGELPGAGTVIRLRLPQKLQAGGQQVPEAALYVQPDCEVVAPPDLPYTLRWQLEELAAVKTDGAVTVYKLTQASISQAVRSGWSEAELQQWLRTASQEAVPGNVSALVGEWARQAGRVRFEQTVLLRCADHQTARQLAGEPRLQGLLGELFGEQDFAVDPQRLSELRGQLERLGLPTAPVVPEDGLSAQAANRTARGGKEAAAGAAAELFYDPHSVKHCAPIHPLEAPMPLAEAMKELPKCWTRELRSYHTSTKKELLEQALQWQTAVELRTERTMMTLIPSHMQDEEKQEGWYVEGWLRKEGDSIPERVTLRPGMWEEMRLVPPRR